MKPATNPSEQYKHVRLVLPDGRVALGERVVLHACCAPCSAAIVECLLRSGMVPTVYFSNANIYPLAEYEKRRQELVRFLEAQGVAYVLDDYDHDAWLQTVNGLEDEPERGRRCSVCFYWRLSRAARFAAEQGIALLTTTLASSRWKDIAQINAAGQRAVTPYPDLTFWEQNWRKGGLQLRRNELLRLHQFYNQPYCGCEYSYRPLK